VPQGELKLRPPKEQEEKKNPTPRSHMQNRHVGHPKRRIPTLFIGEFWLWDLSCTG
jgi:hypothetical protein